MDKAVFRGKRNSYGGAGYCLPEITNHIDDADTEEGIC